MKTQKIVSYILIAAGLLILGVGFYYKGQLSKAMQGFDHISSAYSNNPFGSVIRSETSSRMQGYAKTLNLILTSGFILKAVGGYYAYRLHKKS